MSGSHSLAASFCKAALLLIPFALLAVSPARAALFDDDEARKRILQVEAEMRQKDLAVAERLDRLEASVKNLGILELVNQIEELRAEISRMRGQMEVLNNQIATVDKKQRDFYLDIDSRLRRLEQPLGGPVGGPVGGNVPADGTPGSTPPSSITPGTAPTGSGATAPAVDPKQAALRAAAERKAYDAANELFQKRNYLGAISAFQNFISEYPASASAPSAVYWTGLAQYNLRDLKSALATQQGLVKTYPESSKVPDALLAMAAIEADRGSTAGSRVMLEDIIARYPASEAAAKARQRLALSRR